MPRNARCVWPGVAFHITQRGTDRQSVFYTAGDRQRYLSLLQENLADSEVRILAFCLMTNHVHLVVVPGNGEGLAVLFRRVHGRYAQYLNIKKERSGHLWQNRFFSCALSSKHLWTAVKYVEENPVRAGLGGRAEDYRWSSAAAHLSGEDWSGILDMRFWAESGGTGRWQDLLGKREEPSRVRLLRRCTYAGRPFGEEGFLQDMEARFQRKWRRWAFENPLHPQRRDVVMAGG